MSTTGIFQDIGLVLTITSALPTAVSTIETLYPQVETEAKNLLNAILVPAKALIADAKLTFQGGTPAVVTANGQKALSDLMTLFVSITTILPTAEADASGAYAELLPVIKPMATAIGLALPAAIFTATATSGGTVAPATAAQPA